MSSDGEALSRMGRESWSAAAADSKVAAIGVGAFALAGIVGVEPTEPARGSWTFAGTAEATAELPAPETGAVARRFRERSTTVWPARRGCPILARWSCGKTFGPTERHDQHLPLVARARRAWRRRSQGPSDPTEHALRRRADLRPKTAHVHGTAPWAAPSNRFADAPSFAQGAVRISADNAPSLALDVNDGPRGSRLHR